MDTFNIYILLTKTNTVMSRLISFAKRDYYTHTSISLNENLNGLYSFSRKYTYNPIYAGFKIEDVNRGVYKVCKKTDCTIIKVPVTRQQYEKSAGIIDAFIQNKDDYRYNYLGIIYSFLNRPMTEKKYDFLCSEFVCFVLKEAGVLTYEMPRNLVRPQLFLDTFHFEDIIYKGRLTNYEPAIDLSIEENEFYPKRVAYGLKRQYEKMVGALSGN